MNLVHYRDFRPFARDRHVDATLPGRAQLAPTVLLTHEMGVNGEIAEELSATNWARVQFHLPWLDSAGGVLLFYVNSDARTQQRPMSIHVNGHRLIHRQRPERMLTGGWDRCRIPAGCLRPGANEFVFSGNGLLHVDPVPGGLAEVPGGSSSRSFDGGRTWHQGAHGPGRDLAGEYLVRLRLKGYAPHGLLTAPCVDLADVADLTLIAAPSFAAAVRLVAAADTPAGTAIEFELRTGSTPTFDPRTWSPWQPGTALQRAQRFLEWRAHLRTTSAARTPRLRSVRLEIRPARTGTARCPARVVTADQPKLTRSSYPYTFMGPDPRQQRLREQYRLDRVIAAGRSELEQLALLRDWVHSQWLGWQSDKYPYCPSWDPLEILAVTKGNWGFGMCTHYAATFTACAAALGFVSRSVIVDHHCLAEVWSEDLQKWILQDPGPAREYDATYELDGVPLNALELHELLARGEQGKVMANKLPQACAEPMAAHVSTFVRFGMPLRNDHLQHSEPAELRHGQRQYHWDGYLWWSDAATPRYAEYSLQTTRAEDFYWPANQTRVYLEQTGQPDVIRVLFAHTMPNFDHFVVRHDEGPWAEHAGPTLEWVVRPGTNLLEAAAVNAFGRRGRSARLVVEVPEPRR